MAIGEFRRPGMNAADYLKRTIMGLCLAVLSACASHPVHQTADLGWTPSVERPTHAPGAGSMVLVDAAHGNWHTIEGRFRPFADLLAADGYRVQGADEPISAELLARADIFVTANPVLGGEASRWVLPTPPAFTQEEVVALEGWVAQGGSLLLIADHMPFGGSAENLAAAFGIVFHNGYARPAPDGSGWFSFTRESGALADHDITRGRTAGEAVALVRSFTGQAFRAVVPVEPLMTFPEGWSVFLPVDADRIGPDTPRISAGGLMQGAVLRHGAGRVAVFGEAAMFTAQAIAEEGGVRRIGMNNPDAPHNARFVLNVIRWLSDRQ